jgi:hypothetical protein
MIRQIFVLTAVLMTTTAFATDGPTATTDSRVIFNGKDLTGWDGDPRLWSVKDGVIHGETTAENAAKGNTFLIWKDGTTKDFELRLLYRCNAANNSGIQYRSKHFTEKVQNNWVVKGYQHELRNEMKLPNVSGFIYDEGGKRARICLVGEQATWEVDGKKVVKTDLIDQAGWEKLFKLNEWNEVTITAQGNNVPRPAASRRCPHVGRVQRDPHPRTQVAMTSCERGLPTF